MAWIAQILGWLSVLVGAGCLLFGLSDDHRPLLLFAPGLILGGALVSVLGEIGANVERIRQLADKQAGPTPKAFWKKRDPAPDPSAPTA